MSEWITDKSEVTSGEELVGIMLSTEGARILAEVIDKAVSWYDDNTPLIHRQFCHDLFQKLDEIGVTEWHLNEGEDTRPVE